MENFDYKGDALIFLWFPIFHKFRLHPIFAKIWNAIGWFIMMFIIIWESLFVFFMMTDLRFFQEYITFYLAVQVVGMANVMDIMVFNPIICLELSHWLKEYGLPWNAAGERKYAMILSEVKLFKKFMMVIMFGLLLIHVTLLPFPKICEPYHRMSQEYFSDWTEIIDITVLIIISVIGYRTCCCLWKVLYVFKHAKIQCFLLNGLLDNKSSECNEEDLSNDDYQRITYGKLIQFVKAHQKTKKLFGLIVQRFGWIVLPIHLFTCLSTVSVLYLCMSGYSMTGGSTQTSAIVSIVVLTCTMLLMLNGGQQIMDEEVKYLLCSETCKNTYKSRKLLYSQRIETGNLKKEMAINSINIE